MRLRLREQDLRGLDDGFTRAIELVVTPVVFALIGYGLDRLLGITPILTVALAIFAIVGQSIVMWYQYDAKMRAHEAELQERRKGPAPHVPADEGHR